MFFAQASPSHFGLGPSPSNRAIICRLQIAGATNSRACGPLPNIARSNPCQAPRDDLSFFFFPSLFSFVFFFFFFSFFFFPAERRPRIAGPPSVFLPGTGTPINLESPRPRPGYTKLIAISIR